MRIHGGEVKENEDEEGIMNVREACYSSVNLQFHANDIDRAHLILIKTRERKRNQ